MGAKVTVACKMAIAWFELQLCEPEEVYENTQTGPRKITIYKRVGTPVRIRGTAYPRGTPPEGFPSKPEMVGGFALTPGVDKEFWDVWVKQHAKAPYVENGMIYAYEKADHVRGQARDYADEVSGLEPVNPKGDMRMPKPITRGVGAVETEESRVTKIDKALAASGA